MQHEELEQIVSLKVLVGSGLPIVPVKLYSDETQNLLCALEKLRPYRHNISHSDQILQLLNLPVVPVNII